MEMAADGERAVGGAQPDLCQADRAVVDLNRECAVSVLVFSA